MVRRRRPALAARIALWALAPLAAALLAVAGAVAFVNARVIPPAVDALTARAESDAGIELVVGAVRYRPLRGLQLEDVSAGHAGSGVALSLDRARLRYPVRSLLRLRRDGVPSVGGADGVWPALRMAAGAGIVPASATVDSLRLELSVGGRRVTLLVDETRLRHDARAAAVDATARAPGSPGAELALRANYAERRATIESRIRDLDLTTLGLDRGRASGELIVRVDGDDHYDVAGSLGARDAVADLRSLAERPVEIGALDYRFAATVEPSLPVHPALGAYPPFPVTTHPPGRIRFHTGDLTVNGIVMELRPQLIGMGFEPGLSLLEQIDRRRRVLELAVRLGPEPLGSIRDAVPDALLGDLAAIELEGALGWELDVSVPLHRIGEMSWRSRVDVDGFRVERIPRAVSPFGLNDSFVHVIRDRSVGYERTVRIPATVSPPVSWTVEHGEHAARFVRAWRAEDARIAADVAEDPPQVVSASTGAEARNGLPAAADPDPAYRYVRLTEMSPWVVRAVLTSEDGDFFFHEGVNFYTLPRALERNVRAGEIRFGASTLSMQLVKMLFLDHQRLVSRKLQEVFIVYLMEHRVPVSKERILELYLNLAEFGPGIFGVADAARAYFAKDPAELTAGEATWLASILPSPKRYHASYRESGISPGWFERMKGYFDIMLERGRMTEEEHAEASRRPPLFAPRAARPANRSRWY